MDLSMKSSLLLDTGTTPDFKRIPCFGVITPESPTFSTLKPHKQITSPLCGDQAVLPTPKQQAAQPPTLFRPWDTPESLSPSSSENISPTSSSSNLQTSPEQSSLHSSPPTENSLGSSPPEIHTTTGSNENTPPFAAAAINFPQTVVKKERLQDEVPATPYFSLLNSIQSPSFYSPYLSPFHYKSLLEQQGSAGTKRKIEDDLGASPNLPKRSKLSYEYGYEQQQASQMLFSEKSRFNSGEWLSAQQISNSPGGETTKRVARVTPGSGDKAGGPPCGVCKEPTRPGHHYGAAVCEGCKGFFRRRVLQRDIQQLVCGRGDNCDLTGRSRIHCKLCRWRRCLDIGMNPAYVKGEMKSPKEKLSLPAQVLALTKDHMETVPAIYLGRGHANNISSALVKHTLPNSADLSKSASQRYAGFIRELPGYADWTESQKHHVNTTGLGQLKLLRFIARYRPDCSAFLFPGGEFLYPQQLDILPELQHGLITIAEMMSQAGLTDLELAVLSVLVIMDPLDLPPLYNLLLEELIISSSFTLLPILLMVQELFDSFPHSWSNVQVKTVAAI